MFMGGSLARHLSPLAQAVPATKTAMDERQFATFHHHDGDVLRRLAPTFRSAGHADDLDLWWRA